MLIYTCVTLCLFTCYYLWCLNACQWRCGLQTFFQMWFTCVTILFNHVTDGYCHSLFICYTLITQYYHNITLPDVKYLHLTLYDSSKSRTPPSLNHNNTLYDMPTYHLLRLLNVGSFFFLDMHLKNKVKSEMNCKKFYSNYWEISEEIVIHLYVLLLWISKIK